MLLPSSHTEVPGEVPGPCTAAVGDKAAHEGPAAVRTAVAVGNERCNEVRGGRGDRRNDAVSRSRRDSEVSEEGMSRAMFGFHPVVIGANGCNKRGATELALDEGGEVSSRGLAVRHDVNDAGPGGGVDDTAQARRLTRDVPAIIGRIGASTMSRVHSHRESAAKRRRRCSEAESGVEECAVGQVEPAPEKYRRSAFCNGAEAAPCLGHRHSGSVVTKHGPKTQVPRRQGVKAWCLKDLGLSGRSPAGDARPVCCAEPHRILAWDPVPEREDCVAGGTPIDAPAVGMVTYTCDQRAICDNGQCKCVEEVEDAISRATWAEIGRERVAPRRSVCALRRHVVARVGRKERLGTLAGCRCIHGSDRQTVGPDDAGALRRCSVAKARIVRGKSTTERSPEAP